VGATTETDYLDMFGAAGLVDVDVLVHHDYFGHTGSQPTRNVAQSLGAIGVVMIARKPVA